MRLIALLLALCLAGPLSATADDSVAAARTIINAQADAFARDDAVTAYGYAAPQIQSMFSQPDTFIAMVRKSYAPVYRHKTFEFGDGRMADGKVVQRVHIVDTDGVAWIALYTLEQQADSGFKIIGCVLLKADEAV